MRLSLSLILSFTVLVQQSFAFTFSRNVSSENVNVLLEKKSVEMKKMKSFGDVFKAIEPQMTRKDSLWLRPRLQSLVFVERPKIQVSKSVVTIEANSTIVRLEIIDLENGNYSLNGKTFSYTIEQPVESLWHQIEDILKAQQISHFQISFFPRAEAGPLLLLVPFIVLFVLGITYFYAKSKYQDAIKSCHESLKTKLFTEGPETENDQIELQKQDEGLKAVSVCKVKKACEENFLNMQGTELCNLVSEMKKCAEKMTPLVQKYLNKTSKEIEFSSKVTQ